MIRPLLQLALIALAAPALDTRLRAASVPAVTTNLAGLANLAGPESPIAGAGSSVLRVLGALILVLALFGLAVWCVRHSQRLGLGMRPHARLRVLESRSLSYRHSLYVVAYDQQRFLVGTSPGDITMLGQLPPANPAAADTSPPASFSSVLRQILNRKP
jgi:flagellar biogenesis protein FliO